jgi:hypothetical protein
MSHPIHRAYAAALDRAMDEGTASVIPLGRTVLCDVDDTDLTDSTASGGYMFESKAVGPCCAQRHEEMVRAYGEERFIGERCPAGVSFADWVRGLRGPDAAIRVTPGGSL